MNPLADILARFPLLILDGAFATELERRGCDLHDPLWSAKVLIEDPARIVDVHNAYLNAGADCIITASYQASVPGFMRRGVSEAEAYRLIGQSVLLARQARDLFWSDPDNRKNRPQPLVAASVGPYGACLADGSEYRGDYDLDAAQLVDFHRNRLEILASAGPDLLACETIPCLDEARVLVGLVEEHPHLFCWLSFSGRDGVSISNGERMRDCARWLDGHSRVAAVGINCTPPEHISSLITEIRKETDKPVIVYPNSGEQYDPGTKCWLDGVPGPSILEMARGWYEQGARIIGGCCRTTPADIGALAGWARDLSGPVADAGS